jgi:hypothetical protein
MLNVIMLNVVMMNVVMLNAVMLNAVMLNAVMLNAVMLNVVAPFSMATATNLPPSTVKFLIQSRFKTCSKCPKIDI